MPGCLRSRGRPRGEGARAWLLGSRSRILHHRLLGSRWGGGCGCCIRGLLVLDGLLWHGFDKVLLRHAWQQLQGKVVGDLL